MTNLFCVLLAAITCFPLSTTAVFFHSWADEDYYPEPCWSDFHLVWSSVPELEAIPSTVEPWFNFPQCPEEAYENGGDCQLDYSNVPFVADYKDGCDKTNAAGIVSSSDNQTIITTFLSLVNMTGTCSNGFQIFHSKYLRPQSHFLRSRDTACGCPTKATRCGQ